MTVAAALALLLATGSTAGLDEAHRAFAAADYPAAERLALAAAEGEDRPAALYLAGLARFRAGRPAEALEALDQAEAGADSPAAWRFNRGACLYELSRYAEAEAAFLSAASSPAFEALALVNAGFAALDGGAPGRAAAHAALARARASGQALVLVEELEAALAQPAGEAPALPAGQAPARPGAEPPASPSPSAWSLAAHLEGGHDDDASRAATGAVERPGSSTRVPSPFAAASASGEWRTVFPGATLAAGYGLAQTLYLDEAAEDYDVQQHDLLLAARARPIPSLQLELALTGQYALAGRSNRRGLQAAGGGRLAAALASGDRQVTRAEVSLTAKDGRGAEFVTLDGSRLEATASHELTWDRLAVRGGYRFQLERIGTATTALPSVPPGTALCPFGCAAADVERLSYAGHTGWLSLHLTPFDWLRVDLLGGAEGRLALSTLRTVLTPAGGTAFTAGTRQRSDLRGFGAESAALRLAPWLWLTLRHDWLANQTRLTPVQAGMGPGSHGNLTTVTRWGKQVLSVGLAAAW